MNSQRWIAIAFCIHLADFGNLWVIFIYIYIYIYIPGRRFNGNSSENILGLCHGDISNMLFECHLLMMSHDKKIGCVNFLCEILWRSVEKWVHYKRTDEKV